MSCYEMELKALCCYSVYNVSGSICTKEGQGNIEYEQINCVQTEIFGMIVCIIALIDSIHIHEQYTYQIHPDTNIM